MDLPTGHVSQGPPTIPDGRISRVRFWPRLCTPFLRAGLPPRRETAVLAHPSPQRGGVCIAPSPRRRHRRIRLCVRVRTNCRGHRVPRAPLPGAGVTRAGAASRPPGGALPPRRRSYGLMRQTTALPAPRLAPCAQGLCRLSPVPAGRWPFPTLSPRSLRRCSDPYPAALLGCTCPLLHRGHRSHPTLDGFDARIYPHTATSVGSPISRLQSFVYLRAPTLARPPDCSHRSSADAAGRPGLSHHASPGRLPGPGCGVATCSTRTIGMTGLSPAGSRPCRPLPNALGSCLGYER
jgi:hypothetical protein